MQNIRFLGQSIEKLHPRQTGWQIDTTENITFRHMPEKYKNIDVRIFVFSFVFSVSIWA